MGFIRKLLLVILLPIFIILLFAFALDEGVLGVAGSSNSLKHLVAKSGIYNSVVENALEQAQKSAGSSNEISLTDPAIKSAAQSSFSPQVVQQSSEEAIDGVYDWLNGQVPQPDFNIDLSNQKIDFAQKVGQAAQQRAATLPVCTSAPSSSDPLSVNCLPPGYTPQQIGLLARNDVLDAQGFLQHPVITANNIKKTDQNRSVFSGKLQRAPMQYQRVKSTPFILGILAVVTALAIFFLGRTRRKGLRWVGIALVVAGVLVVATAAALNHAAATQINNKVQFDNKVLQADAQILIKDTVQATAHSLQKLGIIYSIVGLLTIVFSFFIRTRTRKLAPENGSTPSAAPRPSQHSQSFKAPAKKPTRRAPPKIQG